MKKETIVVIMRSLLLALGIILCVKWFNVKWYQAWVVFGCFASSATLHLKKEKQND